MPLINTHYFFTYVALVRRDLKVIRQRLRTVFIDGFVQLIIQLLTFGALFPAMGVSSTLIAPLFIGSITFQLFFLGMGFGIRSLFDIKFNRFIDYRLTLPLPKRWLFAASITYFCLEALIVSLPLLTFGIIVLAQSFGQMTPQWALFSLIYLLILSFYGLLFLGFSFYYSFDWFMQNLWARRLSFLLMISPIFVVWQSAYQFSPSFGRVMLLSPITYAAEGLRASLIGGSSYLHPVICIVMLLIWVIIGVGFAATGIKKRLDPV